MFFIKAIKFINQFLVEKDGKIALKKIGKNSYLRVRIAEVEAIANKRIPISYLIASLSTISQEGHVLKGSSDGRYSWFMEIYKINLSVAINYLCDIFYKLMKLNDKEARLDKDNLVEHFTNSKIFEKKNLDIILVGLERYFSKDYISSMHILIPQFEGVFLDISGKMGINIVSLNRESAVSTSTITLSEKHLDSPEFTQTWGADLCREIKFILFEQLGYRMRHKIAHGDIDSNECNFENTTLILYLYLILIGIVALKPKSDEEKTAS